MGLLAFIRTLLLGPSSFPSTSNGQGTASPHASHVTPLDTETSIGAVDATVLHIQHPDAPNFTGRVDVLARNEGDGTITVLGLSGVTDTTERRTKYCLTRNSEIFSMTHGDIDNCGVGLARLAGDMRSVRLPRSVLLDEDQAIHSPNSNLTQEVTIIYRDHNGQLSENIRLSVLGFTGDELGLSGLYIKAWTHQKRQYRDYWLDHIQEVRDALANLHEPVAWARSVVTIKKRRGPNVDDVLP